jgi:putative transposase
MRYDSQKHYRRSIRLKGYDYTQAGAYFITICTHERACLFGEGVDGELWLNDAGRIAERCWLDIPHHFPHTELDTFVVMPNHLHGIIWIVRDIVGNPVGAKNFLPLRSPLRNDATHPVLRSPSNTIGSVVRGFKIGITKWVRQNTDISAVWQRNYYEHIVRDDESLNRIRQYILDNPARWVMDRENPQVVTPEPEAAWLA